MYILTAKWIILAVLCSSTLLFSTLPILFRNSVRPRLDSPNARCNLAISLVSCFSGGVFMATGFLDLFPEVDDAFKKAKLGVGYPVAEYLIAIGFFLVLIVEQVVLYFRERVLQVAEHDDGGPVNASRDEHNPAERFQGSLVGVSDRPLITSSTSSIQSQNDSVIHSSFRAILLASALSLHAIFEGLAIGLQTSLNKLLQIFIAVLLHKSVIAFSLGLKLVQTELKFWSIVRSTLIFSFAAPTGLGLALLLEEHSQTMHLSVLNGILQGLACGTFFYITFFEVLPQELNKAGNRLMKTFSVFVGFSAISAVLILDPDNQGSDSSEVSLLSRNCTYPHLM